MCDVIASKGLYFSIYQEGTSIKRQPVKSSSLRAIGFDHQLSILEAEFSNGGVYQYFGVPLRIYRGLLAAASKGSFFNAHIRDNFPATKIEGDVNY